MILTAFQFSMAVLYAGMRCSGSTWPSRLSGVWPLEPGLRARLIAWVERGNAVKGSDVGEHDAQEGGVRGDEVVLLWRVPWDGLRGWSVVRLGVLSPFGLLVRTEDGNACGATCWRAECRRFEFSVKLVEKVGW